MVYKGQLSPIVLYNSPVPLMKLTDVIFEVLGLVFQTGEVVKVTIGMVHWVIVSSLPLHNQTVHDSQSVIRAVELLIE